MKKNILILGGSTEAFNLAEKLKNHPNYHAISSLAGRTSVPRKPAGTFRTGGFGGVDGLATYLKQENISAIIDATHPFAQKITTNASLAANQTNIPIIHISRTPWEKKPNDKWIEVDTMQEAATKLDPTQSPCFLTIGRLELSAFLNRTDIKFLCRAIEPPKTTDPIKNQNKRPPKGQTSNEEQWPENFLFLYAKGPYNYDNELNLINEHNIKAIVTKNSGGDKARAKLDVARKLKLPVIMVKRPNTPHGLHVQTTNEALSWLEDL